MIGLHESTCATCGGVLCPLFHHEHVDEVGLINCEELVYEDEWGRWFHNDCMAADLDNLERENNDPLH